MAYQQRQTELKRKSSSCPRKSPLASVSLTGAVTRNSTGEPFTTRAGSQRTLHLPSAKEPAEERGAVSRSARMNADREINEKRLVADRGLNQRRHCFRH